MESPSSNSESETSDSSDSGLRRFGRVTTGVELIIDLDEMFEKSNYRAFLAQSSAREMSDWTGVPLTVDEPIGEFAACVARHGDTCEINLAFAGKFSSMWSKSDLLLIVTNEDDKQLLVPGIDADEKLFFLVCAADPQKPQESLVAPFMAIMEPWYYHDVQIATPNIAYTMLLNAYLETLF